MSDDKTSLKEVVASYLRKNPDFLADYPDILEHLEIQHQAGAAVSLIERQVEQLRASNADLSRQLDRLIQVARENEELMTRLHKLTLELTAIADRNEFFTHLGNSLLNDFNADILQICLFDRDIAAEAGGDVIVLRADDPGLEPFQRLLEQGKTVCGRFNEAKMDFLFGSKARWVQSTALIPLGEKGAQGMMAIGSSDQARFFPGMGTLFLDLLADVVSNNLARDVQAEQRRTA